MLLNKDTNPKRDIYFLGAMVINAISNEEMEIDIAEIYQRIKSEIEISFNLLIQTLDWLYLLDVISIDDNKVLRKCF